MPEYEPRRKVYRKRKKHEGVGWEPEILKLEEARKHDRVYCKTCRKSKRWQELDSKLHPVAAKVYQMVWYCRSCGDAVRVHEYDLGKK